MNQDVDSINIEQLVSDREAFNAFLYTPLAEALHELELRSGNSKIDSYLTSLPAGIPEGLSESRFGAVFRPLATPDFELRRFVSIVEATKKLHPVILEYQEDLYANRNECKFALGKLCFNTGKSKSGDFLFTCKNIIDINEANKRKISEVETHWGQRLVDFHHEFLKKEFTQKIEIPLVHFDISQWVVQSGKTPRKYYEAFLSLFLKHGILFENFFLDQKEISFTKEVILPAFLAIYKATGYKPLIVALQPTEIEGHRFWLSHPGESMGYIAEKLNEKRK